MSDEAPVRHIGWREFPLSVAFNAREKRQVQDAAALCGDRVSTFIRQAALKHAARVVARAKRVEPTDHAA
jgi:uncharacterized protein (DUF1778 family)